MTSTPSDAELLGRRAFVTGGANGSGSATARRLVDRGANVIVGFLDRDGGRTLGSATLETP